MYKFDRNHQFSLSDFNQPIGLKMNPENRWVKKAETIPWKEIEETYNMEPIGNTTFVWGDYFRKNLLKEYDEGRNAGEASSDGTWLTADPETV